MPYLNTTRILTPTVRPNRMIATMNALIEGLAFSGRHIFVGQAGAIFGINRVRLASAKADDKVGPINTPITSCSKPHRLLGCFISSPSARARPDAVVDA